MNLTMRIDVYEPVAYTTGTGTAVVNLEAAQLSRVLICEET